MSKLDFDKPLECEYGPLSSHKVTHGGKYVKCTISATKWIVRSDDGTPQHDWMPRVYNAKRKPETGEWWMCNLSGDENYRVVLFKGTVVDWYIAETGMKGSGVNYSDLEVTPLYLMTKDQSYKEQE